MPCTLMIDWRMQKACQAKSTLLVSMLYSDQAQIIETQIFETNDASIAFKMGLLSYFSLRILGCQDEIALRRSSICAYSDNRRVDAINILRLKGCVKEGRNLELNG